MENSPFLTNEVISSKEYNNFVASRIRVDSRKKKSHFATQSQMIKSGIQKLKVFKRKKKAKKKKKKKKRDSL